MPTRKDGRPTIRRIAQAAEGAGGSGAPPFRPEPPVESRPGAGRHKLHVEQVPVSRLKPWTGNPRIMPPAEEASLERSEEKWGLLKPIISRQDA